MAEGDTILRTARRLDAALAGKPVAVRAPSPRGKASGVERLDGLRAERVESRGKHLLVHFEGGLVLHSHLGMSGSWQLYPSGARWRKSPRAAWAVLSTEGTDAVLFGGTTLRVLPAGRVVLDRSLARLGPDILGPDFESAAVAGAIKSGAARRELGDALLDQGLVAGIGNIFKSEGCFAAGVSPWRRVDQCEEPEIGAVLEETRRLMNRAVVSGRQPRSVYRRAGRPCPRCGAALRSRGHGDDNRTTYWCEGCQS
jgi:endonuclease VIII